ncbi:MarR family transcriptional regulator [Nonomuraea dietziae]
MTGILDRLERGGWVARERDPSDRGPSWSERCASGTQNCWGSTRG